MRNSLAATLKRASAGAILAHLALALLIVVSFVETWQMAATVVHAMGSGKGLLLDAALAAALVPAGCVIFWGCDAIKVQLEPPFRRARQYLRGHSR